MIAQLCGPVHKIRPRDHCEFLDAHGSFTHLLINPTAYRVCRGLHMRPAAWERDGWKIHECLKDPITEFAMRAPHARPGHGGLVAAVDWTVPMGTGYLVDAREMTLHVGPRRIYYQDDWFVVVEICGFEASKRASAAAVSIELPELDPVEP